MTTSMPMGKTGYGIDDHRTIIELTVAGVLSVIIGLLISVYTSVTQPGTARLGLLIGTSVGFLILVVSAALYWSSRLGKVKEIERIVNDLPWGGGETVLDLGCGRGLAMVSAAKRLTSGYTVGVDTWPKSRLSGNDPKSIWANAIGEGVESKMTAVRGIAVSLPFADESFDIILSGVAVHRLTSRKNRRILFGELVRVLRQGGRVGILDAGNGAEYAKLMRASGLWDVETKRLRFSSFPPFHVVTGRKRYSG